MAASPWLLDPDIAFLNHGSFGACPRPVLQTQQRWRERMEREPVRFLADELEMVLGQARAELAAFLTAPADDLAFIPNTTYGINSVLRSLPFTAGDEILLTDHEYNACTNAARYVAESTGASLRHVQLPMPVPGSDALLAAIRSAAGPRTRLLLIDHVTSATGIVMPLATLVKEMAERGIDTLVDGAHAPGMLDVKLHELAPAYYVGNLHKWVCAPKGAAFLYVRPDRQQAIRPLAISHGANSRRRDQSRFRLEFDWTGTFDPSPYLAVPAAIHFMAGLHPRGWPGLRAANHQLVLQARDRLCQVLECEAPVPPELIGSLAVVPLPDSPGPPALSALYQDPLQQSLLQDAAIQVPIIPWPEHPRRLLRLSAQAYNSMPQYEALAAALPRLLAREARA